MPRSGSAWHAGLSSFRAHRLGTRTPNRPIRASRHIRHRSSPGHATLPTRRHDAARNYPACSSPARLRARVRTAVLLERHRHRYELTFVPRAPGQHWMKSRAFADSAREIVEIADHPFYLGTRSIPIQVPAQPAAPMFVTSSMPARVRPFEWKGRGGTGCRRRTDEALLDTRNAEVKTRRWGVTTAFTTNPTLIAKPTGSRDASRRSAGSSATSRGVRQRELDDMIVEVSPRGVHKRIVKCRSPGLLGARRFSRARVSASTSRSLLGHQPARGRGRRVHREPFRRRLDESTRRHALVATSFRLPRRRSRQVLAPSIRNPMLDTAALAGAYTERCRSRC